MTDIEILLDRTRRHAVEFLNGLDRRPVHPTATLKELRCRLGAPLEDRGTDAAQVIDDLVIATSGGHLGSASGRSFAWVMGGALPSALAADWLVSTWDNNAALYLSAPAAAVVEEVAGQWVKDILGLPARASFAFTTGCQMAHATCLAAARHALLSERGWNVEREGLFDAPRIRVLANENRHGSLTRALRFLGFGSNCVEPLATDADSRVEPATLMAAIQQKSAAPTIVVLNAADLNVGAFDPFGELIPLAKASGAWVHVDGAFGLWARSSARHRSLADGIEGADSWATDAHKWLNTPQDIGIAIVADPEAHKAAMDISAAYLSADGHARDPLDWTPEWTRRARGFPVYAALRELGREGTGHLIDRCCERAGQLVLGLGALPGVEVVAYPTLNQGLVRFPDNRPDAAASDHDARTDRMIEAINCEGTALFSSTIWKRRRAMRISVVNWRTSSEDVERTVRAVATVLESEHRRQLLR
ncbi:MAG TPA: pyridoxal-dependent decarboxylase [Steroidobacteraceae bacterium]